MKQNRGLRKKFHFYKKEGSTLPLPYTRSSKLGQFYTIQRGRSVYYIKMPILEICSVMIDRVVWKLLLYLAQVTLTNFNMQFYRIVFGLIVIYLAYQSQYKKCHSSLVELFNRCSRNLG